LAANKLEASIFSYDGKDFVRTETTLMQGGQSAVGTKLEHDSPAYKALAEKLLLHRASDRSWSKLPSQLRTAHECGRQTDGRPVCGHGEIVVVDSAANPIWGNDLRVGDGAYKY
jgi:hypothetical protein